MAELIGVVKGPGVEPLLNDAYSIGVINHGRRCTLTVRRVTLDSSHEIIQAFVSKLNPPAFYHRRPFVFFHFPPQP